ncbi:hypothetical protein L3081_02395 [Colwellia sp. MSW7]|uniref:HNH endonuclease n=1 Tax=Colwellia maritima TaxID=2912588 RepID=A0ABS9WWW6_9GAMM|nr:hypothetical protein [Colwellia maritima]MCI2282455.1 hypothetical protein [Colwellia maritima]
MRFVDNTYVDLPVGWEDRAEAATEALLDGTIVADDRSVIWKALRESLEELSNGRCWYCETNIPRTDNAVDHYRPKGKVQGVALAEEGKSLIRYNIAPEHSGYKWAAFNPENFRFSCQHCNEYRKDLQGSPAENGIISLWLMNLFELIISLTKIMKFQYYSTHANG